MYYRDLCGECCEAKKRHRIIDGHDVTTWQREITSANVLEVEAGTNGCQGGDSGHGCRTYFRINDLGSTDICAKATDDGFSVILGGNCELETIKEALRWILSILEVQSENR